MTGVQTCALPISEEFAARVLELTDGRGVDVILDMVGGAYLQQNLSILALEGHLVEIAIMNGDSGVVDLRRILMKRLTLTGSTLRPRTVREKGAIAEALRREVWPLLDVGRVRPVIAQTFPLSHAADAHRLMESSAHIGKLVLVTPPA